MSEEKMKAFIKDLFDEYYPECGDIDGGELQDLAEKHGILVPEIHHEPFGEFCNCDQVCSDEEFEEGVKCFHLANWLSANERTDNIVVPTRCKICNSIIGWHHENRPEYGK